MLSDQDLRMIADPLRVHLVCYPRIENGVRIEALLVGDVVPCTAGKWLLRTLPYHHLIGL